MQSVLNEVALPLKSQVCSLGMLLEFVFESGCLDCGDGQEYIFTIKTSVSAAHISGRSIWPW